MSETIIDTLINKIPELFYDIIGRLIPGFLVVVLFSLTYFQIDFNGDLFNKFEKISFAQAILIFVISYFVGLSLDMIGGTLIEPILYGLREIKLWPFPTALEQWERVRKVQENKNNRLLKLRAEILLFRSVALGTTLLAIYSGFKHLAFLPFLGIAFMASICALRLSYEFKYEFLNIHHPKWNSES